jgi:hypothetical protein
VLQVVQNGRRFAVERDIVQLFQEIGQAAANSLARHQMAPAVLAFINWSGSTDEELARSCEALAEFVNIARTQNLSGSDLAGAWVNSGLAALDPAAQMAMFAALGMAVTNAYFIHARASLPTTVAGPGVAQLSEVLARAAHTLRSPDPAAARRRAADLAAASDRALEDSGQKRD